MLRHLKNVYWDTVWQQLVTVSMFGAKTVISVGSSSGLPYKVYTALLSQSGTNTPVATILQNTIGDIVWTRQQVGTALGTLAGTFIGTKTWLNGSLDFNISNDGILTANWKDIDSVNFQTLGLDGFSHDGYAIAIEIRIYP